MSRKNIGFVAITLALVGIIVFCAAGTVRGQENLQNQEKEQWYREREGKLLSDTREYLSEKGFHNSGVTLNRVVDEDGSRAYTFTIHHARIDRMTEGERAGLRRELYGLTEDFRGLTPEEGCTFAFVFLNV
ncbi:MAG: hypothetical protein NC092_10825 [Butyrivibrio sp.]|nr:hypothetical protein [Muribaculum sp.]MCM1553174.1 hypothetical protein [Butyrivibrio sp.]